MAGAAAIGPAVARGRDDRRADSRRADRRDGARAAARPLVLGGCCCAHVGAVRELARRHGRIALVWFDAHGDLNTAESSPSGNAWGMPLRMLIDAGDVEARDVTLLGAPGPRPARGRLHPARRASAVSSASCRTMSMSPSTATCSHPAAWTSSCRSRAGRRLPAWSPSSAAIPAPAGLGLTGLVPSEPKPRRSCPASRTPSASDGAACNRSVTDWGLSSRHVRGPDRRPGRAQERSTA